MEYLSTVVGTVLGEDVVYLRLLDGAEHQRLPVVSSPVVQVPHPHPREVHSMGVQWLQVQVLHHMLVQVDNVRFHNKSNIQTIPAQ